MLPAAIMKIINIFTKIVRLSFSDQRKARPRMIFFCIRASRMVTFTVHIGRHDPYQVHSLPSKNKSGTAN